MTKAKAATEPVEPTEPEAATEAVTVDEVQPEAATEDTQVTQQASSASVITDTGAVARVYTLEDHGSAFADLAKEFSEHTPGSTIKLN